MAIQSTGTASTVGSPQLAWWEANRPDVSGFNTLAGTTGGYGKSLMDAAMGMQALLANPQAARSTFGFENFPDINDPRTLASLKKWTGLFEGGTRNLMDEQARRMAGISAAGSRFRPSGAGAGTAAQLAAQGNRAIAESFGGNVEKGMGFLGQKANTANSIAQALAGLYGQTYGSTLGAGQGMYNTALGATSGAANTLGQWRTGAGAGLASDVGWQNQLALRTWDDQRWRDQLQWEREKYMKAEAERRQRESDANWGRTQKENELRKLYFGIPPGPNDPYNVLPQAGYLQAKGALPYVTKQGYQWDEGGGW